MSRAAESSLVAGSGELVAVEVLAPPEAAGVNIPEGAVDIAAVRFSPVSASWRYSTGYSREIELDRAAVAGRVGVPSRPRGVLGVTGRPNRGATTLGRGLGLPAESTPPGSSGSRSASRKTCTATALAAACAGVAGTGVPADAAIRSRSSRSQRLRVSASRHENMYLRFKSRWLVKESCEGEYVSVWLRGKERRRRKTPSPERCAA